MVENINSDILALTIGKNVTTYRTLRKIDVKVAAKDLEIDPEVLQAIEKGNYQDLTLVLIIRMANYFNVTLPQMLELQIVQVFNYSQNILPGERAVTLTIEQTEGYKVYINDLKEAILAKDEKIKELESKLANAVEGEE